MSSIDVELEGELRKILTDPIKGLKKLQQDFGGFEAKMRDGLYGFIARVLCVHRKIVDDPDTKREFVALCEQRGQKAKFVRKDLLLAVFKYVLRAKNKGPMYERARIYSGAMRAAVDAKTDPADIPDLIRQANGIEELYSRQVGKSNERNAASETAASAFDDEESAEFEEDEGGDEENEDTFLGRSGQDLEGSNRTRPSTLLSANSTPKKTGKTENKKKIIFDQRVDLVITFPSSKDLFSLLESGADGGTILFSLVRDGDAPPKAMAIQWTLDE